MRFMVPTLDEIARHTDKSKDEVVSILEMARNAADPLAWRASVSESGVRRAYTVERRAVGPINRSMAGRDGRMWQYEFRVDDEWVEYTAVVKAEVDKEFRPCLKKPQNLIVRIDSGCKTGQLLDDVTCECRDQLRLALEAMVDAGEGVLINIPRQDGRGMGLPFKLATLQLQDRLGLNTVDAAALLAGNSEIDRRTYAGAVAVLQFLGVTPAICGVSLATNNPRKASVFKENDYTLLDFTPIVATPNEYTELHLKAKQKHLGHRDLVVPNGNSNVKGGIR